LDIAFAWGHRALDAPPSVIDSSGRVHGKCFVPKGAWLAGTILFTLNGLTRKAAPRPVLSDSLSVQFRRTTKMTSFKPDCSALFKSDLNWIWRDLGRRDEAFREIEKLISKSKLTSKTNRIAESVEWTSEEREVNRPREHLETHMTTLSYVRKLLDRYGSHISSVVGAKIIVRYLSSRLSGRKFLENLKNVIQAKSAKFLLLPDPEDSRAEYRLQESRGVPLSEIPQTSVFSQTESKFLGPNILSQSDLEHLAGFPAGSST
jgi:hypothetical protein